MTDPTVHSAQVPYKEDEGHEIHIYGKEHEQGYWGDGKGRKIK